MACKKTGRLNWQSYPFTAIVRQENAKKALISALICPEINNVLLMGRRGTGKSTLVRSIDRLLPEMPFVNLPLNATEERVLGSVDIESSIIEGRKNVLPGLLHEAHDGIICIDEINLLDERIVGSVLDAAERGQNIVEREGISWKHDCRFLLVGTMDPSGGMLSAHVMDRFDLCVQMDSLDNIDDRIEVIRKRLAYEANSTALVIDSQQDILSLREKLIKAKQRISYVILPEGHMELIARLATEMGVQGHRGDIAVARTARAIAALEGRDQVIFEDLKEAALLCLEHRRNEPQPSNATNKNESEKQNETDKTDDENQNEADGPDNGNQNNESREEEGNENDISSELTDDGSSGTEDDEPPTSEPQTFGSLDDSVADVGDPFVVIDYLANIDNSHLKESLSRGRRDNVISKSGSGRYVAFRYPRDRVHDLAFDATLRAAAPYQHLREKKGLAVALERCDLREKVRVSKKGTNLLFLVDGSGSMGARKRMIAVKGAILSLLEDAYRKRDAVGMMVFRDQSAELLLPPTRSVDLAYRKLQTLPTGGKTPLAEGLTRAVTLMTGSSMSSENDSVIVLVSDGRANVSAGGSDAFEEALDIANKAADLPVRFVVVDTESGFPRLGLAAKLCSTLQGTYFRLEDLNSAALAGSIRHLVHRDH
ncbi:magnesium chelatase subunit D [Methanococcoides vulcani]|uniref:Magnesium chelatase subunit D n=1 Tax=Methanococcoides vulcani TaxID=1353158 RepID=A0A1H9YMQ5_9EURY|nr:VWA domain-containing protein [Methanococcoides vulcani]SES70334.1 magnesium chelatase subunit D [Methanococcoides vulcani]